MWRRREQGKGVVGKKAVEGSEERAEQLEERVGEEECRCERGESKKWIR